MAIRVPDRRSILRRFRDRPVLLSAKLAGHLPRMGTGL